MNNIHYQSNLQKGSTSIERRKRENNFEAEAQYVLSSKNSKSNQQLQTNSNSGIKLNLPGHSGQGNGRELAFADHNKKAKFVVGGQFRAKNAKKQLAQQNKIFQESTQNLASQYQLQNSATSLQQQSFLQFGQPQTTTNAQRQPMFSSGLQNVQQQLQSIHQQQQIMNSQPSNKSLRSSGSQEQAQFLSQDNQYRRRLVALAQAQQQQILAIHQANTQNKQHQQQIKFLRQNEMQILQSNRRTSNEQADGTDGVQVLSKKMISFRTHSKSQEKNSKIYAENSERMAEFRSQQPTVKSAENTKLNQTQTIAGIVEHQTLGFRPTNDDSLHKNQTANVSNIQLSGFNQSAAIAQLSPRKQGTETFGAGAAGGRVPHQLAGSAASREGSGQASRGKVSRLISGNPQRRLQQQQQSTGKGGDSGQTHSVNPRLTQGVEEQQSQSNSSSHALQAFNRRRQPGDETNQQAVQISNSLSSTKKSNEFQNLAGTSQNSYKALQTIQAGSLEAQSLQNDLRDLRVGTSANNQTQAMNTINSHPNQAKARPQVQKIASSQNTNPAQASGSGNVIYHPHPLNHNIPNINSLQNGALADNPEHGNVKSDSARPSTQKHAPVNNRNSRKNLKPLSKSKQQNSNPNLNLRASRTKNPSRQQYASHAQAPTQVDAPLASSSLHFSQADLAASTSRERTKVFGGTNYVSTNAQVGPLNPAQATGNKISMFKVKRHSSTNRKGLQTSETAYQSQSNTARSRPINQGIMVRKNNYISQQQQQNMQPTLKMAASITDPSPTATRLRQPVTSKQTVGAKKPLIPQIRNSNFQGHLNSDTKASQPPPLAQQFKPSSTQVLPFEIGGGDVELGDLASLTGLPGFEQFVEEQGGHLGSTGLQIENLKNQLLRLNEGYQDNISKPPQTTRVPQQSTNLKTKDDKGSTHQTMLGSLTQNFNQPQQVQQKALLKASEQSIQANSQTNLKLDALNNNKLIKVNKSKKMLDSARRSRIQQLDKDAYNTQAAGTSSQTAAATSAAAPAATNQIKVNYKSSGQPSRTTAAANFNTSLPASSASLTAQHSQDDYLSQNKNVQLPKVPNQNKLQLNMNINTSSANQITPVVQAPEAALPLGAIKNAGGQTHLNLKAQEAATARLVSNAQQTIQPQMANTQRFAANIITDQQKSTIETQKSEIPLGQKQLRRGQIFKKQQLHQEANLDTMQAHQSIQVIKDIIQTKEITPPRQSDLANKAGLPSGGVNPAVKIENQRSPDKQNTYQDIELKENSADNSKKMDGTLSPYQEDHQDMLKDDNNSLNVTDQEFNIQMKQVIKEIEDNENEQLIKANQLNEISEEEDLEKTEDEVVKKNADKIIKDVLQKQKVASQTKKVLEIQNKITEQRTTTDTNSNRKQNADSQQRFNINTSMQNIPRGIINTAFSLGSVVSRENEIPALPTTPQNILRYYINDLSDYEKGEILDYDKIYFLGKSKEKKVDGIQSNDKNKDLTESTNGNNHSNSKSGSDREGKENKEQFNHNYGYDDDKGDYKIIVGDHIGYRYEIVEFLGKGSFGTALRCIDHKEKKDIAIKIVKNKKKYYYQASVELKILQYLKQHDSEDIMNVIHIYDYVIFRKHLCMGFELLSMNLFEFLKINDFNGFDHNLIRRFAIQLLYALKYLKQLEIIHCDLKPENILLKEENKSGIKIIDFGSSTFIDEKVYTYIQSRFYRAPEIMLGIPYTPAIDMWSLGCIMAELYIGYPIFPGESENDQMSRIMEMRDAPSSEVLKMSERKGKFFTSNKETHKLEPIMLKNSRGKLRKPNGKPLDYVIGDEDPDFNDFVIRCLDWNPNTRLTPDEALKHVWVLKGLPPQVLIHHQKMHGIGTPELPDSVKLARDEFLVEQQREQQLMLKKQQQRISNAQRQSNPKDQKREISHNPDVGRPHVQLKTPRTAQQKITIGDQTTNPGSNNQTTTSKNELSKPTNFSQIKKIIFNNTGTLKISDNQPPTQGNTRRKFVIKQSTKH